MNVKLRAGRFLRPATITEEGDRLFIKFGFNKILIKEIKMMQGAKWHGYDPKPRKIWSVAKSPRNLFQLDYLQGKDPYKRYDKELVDFTPRRDSLYAHQLLMVRCALTYKQVIFAAEMGTGKTLAAIEIMDFIKCEDYEAWYVGPKSGKIAVGLELEKWEALVHPRMFTYAGLTKEVQELHNQIVPKIVIFDESSKLKNPQSKRSQAALFLADRVRENDGFIIEMSGTPAPKSPADWWHQCEVACPGFLKEGNIHKFKRNLAMIEERESISGGVYPHIVTWLDDSQKCAKCGKYRDEMEHVLDHTFEPSVDEISRLYKRMSGLTLVLFKKDCTDLPDIQFNEPIQVKPTVDMLRAAKLIAKTAMRSIEALTLCRELSDGFQYKDIEEGREECPNCRGTCREVIKVPDVEVDTSAPFDDITYHDEDVVCEHCLGVGTVAKIVRDTKVVGSPKDAVFINELETHEEIGRYIVWGGFTGTIDRLVAMSITAGWVVLRIDGRGYHPFGDTTCTGKELLVAMDRSHRRYTEYLEKVPRLIVVGQPQSGGMGLTLTAAPTMLFYSNSFDGESKMQAPHRGHRLGMDTNKGLTVKEVFCLPTDKLVYNNLMKKVKLQKLSLGEVSEALNA